MDMIAFRLTCLATSLTLHVAVFWTTSENRAADVPTAAGAIADEVSKKNTDPGGWPLPVASHWARSYGGKNFSSDYQIELLAAEHHVMPNLDMPKPGQHQIGDAARKLVEKLARWQAPFSMRGDNWEAVLVSKDHPSDNPGRWRNLPPEKSARAINLDGTLGRMISPFGADEPWYEAGQYLGGSAAFTELTSIYPNPPRVVLLSNNEAPRLKAKHDIESLCKRYVDQHGTGRSDLYKRTAIVEGYHPKYAGLLRGLREALPSGPWKHNTLLAAYNGFGPPHFGRWDGWDEYSFTTADRIDPWHLIWDGGAPSFYTHNWNASTDYRVHSPQVEANNWVFMLREVYQENPDYWFELSIWDGNFTPEDSRSKKHSYEVEGQQFTPARYGGFVQYGMWLTRPRVVREFRGHGLAREPWTEYYEALVAAVDRVWQSRVLRRFWREGELVPNRAQKHPYQSKIPERWQDVDRWFLLNTNLDPPRPWQQQSELPVFTLARVLGVKGNREWLVYAHAPVEPRSGVEIQIPEYGKVKVDVSTAGNFYHVQESDRSTTPVSSG